MKLGIIGTGAIVQDFLPKLIKLDGLSVISIMDIPTQLDQANRMKKEYGLELATTSFSELCESGIDTIYVAVPNILHYDFCKKALLRGKNVIVEKPMTSSVEEAIELKELAESKSLFLFEAVTTLYLGTYLKIKEWLPKIGQIKSIESNHTQYSRRYDAFLEGIILPAFDPKNAGGALMDLNLYNLHFIMGLVGEPEKVTYYPTIEKNIDTNGLLVLQYPDFIAHCFAAKDCNGLIGSTIQGTKGFIKTIYPPNLVGEVTLQLNDGTIDKFDDKSAFNRLIPEFTTFINAINDKNFDFCYEQLNRSLSVSKVLTKARREAGINFPCDGAGTSK